MNEFHDESALFRYGSPIWLAQLLFSLARRHDLPFSLIAFREVDRKKKRRGASAILLRSLRTSPPLSVAATEALRETDVLIPWGEPGDYIAVCPAADGEGATQLTRRLQSEIGDRAVYAGQATFRDDATDLDGLVAIAFERLDQAQNAGLTFASADVDLAESIATAADGVSEVAARPRTSMLRQRLLSRVVKRTFDLVATLAAAPIWLALVAVIATAVKIQNPRGPIFFIQPRTGRGGRTFGMVKFRTMVPNAEAMKEELRHLSQRAWPDFKIENDPRITRLGAFLRKTSLDEVPQLFNVLWGDMSLVGPRPTSFSVTTYESWHTARLSVRPGMTGLWQVEGRGHTDFDERLRLDLQYIEHQSFVYDLWLLIRTIPALLEQRGGE